MSFQPHHPDPLTVSDLVRRLKAVIEGEFEQVWVEGELSNCRIHTSGHIYLSLKDEKAQVRAVMFRTAARRLRFKPEDGQKIIARGRLSVYEARGDCQLILDQLEPSGIGALQLAFLQLKEKLEKEGLFSPERKRPIPVIPRRIGVVTSPVGAAIRDFLNVARRRFSNMDILIRPAAVQGEAAVPEIVAAVEELNRSGWVDVIVVTRGGGSMEDLWAFNTEPVARAMAASRVPVISAVGHEVDFTIGDYVADLRASTPSAAAELLVANKESQVYQIASLRLRLERTVHQHLAELRSRLKGERRALPDPIRILRDFSQRIDDLATRTASQFRAALALRKTRLEAAAGRLNAMNPLAILGRGYSITTRVSGRKMLTDAGKVQAGERLKTRLKKGFVISEVIETLPQESLFPDREEEDG